MNNPNPFPPTPGTGGPAAGAGQVPVPPGAMRVSDAERNSALEALGEHLSAGRLTLDEYGDRSARVTVAKTADDVLELFEDLPDPHPALPGPLAPGTAAPTARTGPSAALMPAARGYAMANPDTRSAAQKLVGAAAAASVFVALILFFITGLWYWFLLIPAISGIAGSVWGPDWKDPQHGRRELRDRRRGRQLGG